VTLLVSPPIVPLNLLYDHLPCLCFAIDTKGSLIAVSKFALDKLGYIFSELFGQFFWQIIATEDEAAVKNILNLYQSPTTSDIITEQELTLVTVTGAKMQILAKFNLIKDHNFNKFIQIMGIEILNSIQNLTSLTNVTGLARLNRNEENNHHSLVLAAAIFEQAAIGMAICSLEGEFLQVNQKYADILGYSVVELLDKNCQNVTHAQSLAEDRMIRQQLLAGELVNGYLEKKYIRKDGRVIWGALNISLLRDETGQFRGFIKTCQDITERKHFETAFYQQAQKERVVNKIAQRIRQSLHLEDILNITVREVRNFLGSDRVVIYYFHDDCWGEVLVESVENPEFSILGTKIQDPCFNKLSVEVYQEGKISQIGDVYKDIITPCHRQMLIDLQVKANLVVPILVSKSEETLTTEIADFRSNKTPDSSAPPISSDQSHDLWGLLIAHQCNSSRQWQASEIQLLQQLATQLAIAIQQAQLYTKLENLNQELSGMAWSDGLTQIANRRRFDQYLHTEWQRLVREQAPLTLILCDIDHFKLYNDYYGHLSGDLCLQEVARVIKQVTKRPADLAARYGGEELAVILPNTSLKGGIKVAQEIQRSIAKLAIPHIRSTVHAFITLSIGIATQVPRRGQPPEQIINQADQFLYEAKRTGRNRLCWQD
jgi:diguanylate cyclase (GGDEF)-like protein/PAS domain S-box-containing protein